MTMRTREYFACSNGHEGVRKTSENDQPYSKMWESVTLSGMSEAGDDAQGRLILKCDTCGQPMEFVRQT